MTVYLLHFSGQVAKAQHYLGWCAGDPEIRLTMHLSGKGSPLVKAAVDKGLSVRISRLWEGASKDYERRLKDGHNARVLCPLCGFKSKNKAEQELE